MMPPMDFDVGVARRLAQLEKQLGYLQSIVTNPGISQGSWTPAFTGTGTAGAFTYARNGNYIRLGSLVMIRADLGISAIGTPPVGDMTITGLPIASVSLGAVAFGRISNFNYTAAAIELCGDITGTTIRLTEAFDNVASVNVPAATFNNVNCRLVFTGLYLAA